MTHLSNSFQEAKAKLSKRVQGGISKIEWIKLTFQNTLE